MPYKKHLLKTLRDKGFKLTRQRQTIIEVIEESMKHLNAEEIYILAKARDENISLPTVYRTLSLLKELDMVDEQNLGTEHSHFESRRKAPHYHFTCKKCGQIIEFEAPFIQKFADEFAKSNGFQVNNVQFSLSGYCSKCLKEKE